MRLVYHPELRNEIEAWGFKGKEGESQDGKKSRCLVMRYFLAIERSFR